MLRRGGLAAGVGAGAIFGVFLWRADRLAVAGAAADRVHSAPDAARPTAASRSAAICSRRFAAATATAHV